MPAPLENGHRTNIRFYPSNLPMVVTCGRCCALIADDNEGANRGEHEAWHQGIERG